jgi:uncharacterized protein with PhoU and TrkA domain
MYGWKYDNGKNFRERECKVVAWGTALSVRLLQTRSEVLGIVNLKECLEELSVCSKHKTQLVERDVEIYRENKKNNSVQKQVFTN